MHRGVGGRSRVYGNCATCLTMARNLSHTQIAVIYTDVREEGKHRVLYTTRQASEESGTPPVARAAQYGSGTVRVVMSRRTHPDDARWGMAMGGMGWGGTTLPKALNGVSKYFLKDAPNTEVVSGASVKRAVGSR